MPFLASVGMAAPQGAFQGDGAVQTIEQFHGALLKAMKQPASKSLGARRLDLDPVIRKTFDFRRMVQIVVGPSVWRETTPEDRDRLAAAFADMTVSTYTSQFKSWNGEKFETLSLEPGPQGTKLVRTRLTFPKADPVALTYVMAPTQDGGWLVTDVLIKDLISELAVRRSDYARTLADQGVNTLIDRLEGQAKKLVEDKP